MSQGLKLHSTPKHGSWLYIAEIELSALGRQGLGSRRIPDLELLRNELKPWCQNLNMRQRNVDWQFTADDARNRLRSLCPVF